MQEWSLPVSVAGRLKSSLNLSPFTATLSVKERMCTDSLNFKIFLEILWSTY